MKIDRTVSGKPSAGPIFIKTLGLLLVAGGFVVQINTAQHTLLHDAAFALIFAGIAFQVYGTYLFVPAVMFVVANLIGLGPKSWQAPGTAMMVLAFIIGVYGWWKNRQAKTIAKR